MAKKSGVKQIKKRPAAKAQVKTKKTANKSSKITKKPAKKVKAVKIKSVKKNNIKSSKSKAAKPKILKVKSPAQPYCPKGYTPGEYEKYKSELKRLDSYSNQQLK